MYQWDGGQGELHVGHRITNQRHGLVLRWELPCGGGTIWAPHFYRPPPATHPSVRQKLSLSKVDLFAPTPTPPIHQSRPSASAKKPPVPVVRVTGVWSAQAARAGSVTRSQGTASPPPVKALKLESGRRDRVKTPGGKTTHRGTRGIAESAMTPLKVGKGPKKSAQPGVSITAEKGGILPGGRDATASTVVTGQETTARVIAQEGTSIVTGQETTAGVIAQEGTCIVTGQETTAGVSAQEGTSIITGQETTARVIAQEGTSHWSGDHHRSQCPGGHNYRHWSGDHHRSQCPGGYKYRHWSGDHRQSHCPGGHKYRHWSGDHRRSQCPGGPRQPQPRWAMRDRYATHQCTGQRPPWQSTAEQGKHR
ncbi:hypothetical protein NDU88_000847 [Pleurodeles waltl]|uniref:Uncharacterized protein n=1 Tax=Pleurodeles waltl TaxID=8319 RepID=A0AAV7Q587_PLEWA|nr:hypothetical protein NDU88_000847 [Pleurodeles waltl]